MDDSQLLHAYAGEKSQDAFGQLVERYVNMVYVSARRRVGDSHLAEDVTQGVFMVLARKAGAIRDPGMLAGWLLRAAHYACRNAMTIQGRAKHHEQRAAAMRNERVEAAEEPAWEMYAPVVDEAMSRLGEAERSAVALRYLRGLSLREVGEAMGVSEEAARKRVDRGIVNLRRLLAKKVAVPAVAGLAAALGASAVEAAPAGLAEAAIAAMSGGGTVSAGIIAKGAIKMMAWAKLKMAAMILASAGAVSGVGTSYVMIARNMTDPGPGAEAQTPTVAASLPASPTTVEFDGLYEKAPPSGADLVRQVGPNQFHVTAVLRYGADGKPVATDGLGKPMDTAALPMDKFRPGGAGDDVVIVLLEPGLARYDIDRLRIFNHATRRYVRNLVVTPVAGISAVRIIGRTGTLPASIDLWLGVASYGPANIPVSLAPQKGSTVQIGAVAFGFDDIRDGQWDFSAGQFSQLNSGTTGHQTTVLINGAAKWNAGRYQIHAVSKDGRKYLSDFFINSRATQSVSFFPFGLGQIDHFELRPLAKQPPFYFDGVVLPAVVQMPVAPSCITAPVIVKAKGRSRVPLPCGAVVELLGISYHPSAGRPWWGLDGKPVAKPRIEGGNSVSGEPGNSRAREFAARLVKGLNRDSSVLWYFTPYGSYSSGGGDVAASLPKDGPIGVRLGVEATPWQTLEEITVENLPANVRCWPGTVEAAEADDQGVAIRMSTVDRPGNLRIMLMDKAGELHQYNGLSTSIDNEKMPPWGYHQATLVWHNLKLEDVEGICFQTRQEEYAEFDDVPMEPK